MRFYGNLNFETPKMTARYTKHTTVDTFLGCKTAFVVANEV